MFMQIYIFKWLKTYNTVGSMIHWWTLDLREAISHLQKKAMQAITCEHYKCHADSLFKLTQFFNMRDKYTLKTLIFYFNLYHDKLPPHMNDYKLFILPGHSSYELKHHTYQLQKSTNSSANSRKKHSHTCFMIIRKI